MDTISLNPVGPAPVQRSSGGKTTLYIVVFFLCVISIMAGAFYFTLGRKDADSAKKLKELQAKAESDMAATKSEEEKREIQRKAELDAEKSKLKLKEEMLKKAQARVDTELSDAAKRVREAKELQRKAADAKAEAEARKLDAEAAMKKAEETKDANAKKLADEKKRLADEAAAKVAEANSKAAKAVNDAKAEAKKATDLQKRLNGAEAKLLGKRYEETAKYGAVPGFYKSGAAWAGDRLNVANPDLCRNEARNNGWAAWGHRNSKHPNAQYRNSCYFYKTVPQYAGEPNDDVHMVGCAFGGHPKTGCRPGNFGFLRWDKFWAKVDFPGNDIWTQSVSKRMIGRVTRGRNNRNSALTRCANDNRCAAITCNTYGTTCWAKSKLVGYRGNSNDRYTWRAQRGWK